MCCKSQDSCHIEKIPELLGCWCVVVSFTVPIKKVMVAALAPNEKALHFFVCCCSVMVSVTDLLREQWV